jgi:opacity protein-like surface antigen
MLMWTLGKIAACFFLLASVLDAQYPPVAGIGPLVEGGLGYTYVSMDSPSTSRVGMNGLDANVTADFLKTFGVRADLGYARTSNVFNSGHHSDVLSYLAGPVFYPFRRNRFTVYVDLLVGGARVTGVTPNLAGEQFRGFANKLAWVYGVGFQYSVCPSLGIRFDTNYLHTAYFNSSAAVQGQENLRTMMSVVWYFGKRRER